MNLVATTIETLDGWTRMVYHKTCVAKYYAHPMGNGIPVRLDTGGYFTATTKKRMNQFSKMFDLGFSVYQKDGDWFVRISLDYSIKFSGNTCEFTIER